MTATRPSAYWTETFEAAGIPSGPIWTFDRVFTDEHLTGRGFFADAPHPTLGPVRQLGSPMRLSRTPTRIDSAGPVLGADTADVLREIGVDEAEIARLPLRRGTTPEEIAAAVQFILSAPAMTGQMIALDGGQHLGWAQSGDRAPPDE